jgi:hypothetical protein
MKKILFIVTLLLICNIPFKAQIINSIRYQIYDETLIKFVSLMDSILPSDDTLTYFFEKAHGITDNFPTTVKNHTIQVVDLIEIKKIIQSHSLSVWTILPLVIENRKFKVRIMNCSVSKFSNFQGMSWLGTGSFECVYEYDFDKEHFIFDKWL